METTMKLRVRGVGVQGLGFWGFGGRVYAWGRIAFRVQGLRFRGLESRF